MSTTVTLDQFIPKNPDAVACGVCGEYIVSETVGEHYSRKHNGNTNVEIEIQAHPERIPGYASKKYHEMKSREIGKILRDWYNSQPWRSITVPDPEGENHE